MHVMSEYVILQQHRHRVEATERQRRFLNGCVGWDCVTLKLSDLMRGILRLLSRWLAR